MHYVTLLLFYDYVTHYNIPYSLYAIIYPCLITILLRHLDALRHPLVILRLRNTLYCYSESSNDTDTIVYFYRSVVPTTTGSVIGTVGYLLFVIKTVYT